MPLSALACLWDDPDQCPQVRVDGLTGLRYCHLCGGQEADAAAGVEPDDQRSEPPTAP